MLLKKWNILKTNENFQQYTSKNGKQTFENNDLVNQDSPLYLLFQHKGSKGKRGYGKSEEE